MKNRYNIILVIVFSVLFAQILSAAQEQGGASPIVTASGVEIVHDVPFLEPGRTHTLDLYLPKSERGDSARPAIVWIHGGGWGGGSKRATRERVIGQTMAENGYVVVSPDYMLTSETAPEPSFPVPILDCKNAVRFLRANAAKYNIDVDRIAVLGGSAGGHLALMVAYTEGIDELEPEEPYSGVSSRVNAAGSFYGITDLLTRELVNKETGELTGGLANGSSIKLLGIDRRGGRDLWELASPVYHVRAGLPPTFITHGKKDTTVNFQQSTELADALEAAGVPYELVLLESAGHTYYLSTWKKEKLERDLTPLLLNFLETHMPSTR